MFNFATFKKLEVAIRKGKNNGPKMKKLVKEYKTVDDLITNSLGGKIKGADLNSSMVDLDQSMLADISMSMIIDPKQMEPFKISDLTKLITLDD